MDQFECILIGLVQGLDTHEPEIIYGNGMCMTGEYEDTLGDQIFLEESVTGERPHGSNVSGPFPQLLAVTDKSVKFKEKATGTALNKPLPDNVKQTPTSQEARADAAGNSKG